MTEVMFDEASHTYTVAGVVVPSVTTILRDLSVMSRLPDGMLAEASVRGKLVHKAVELWNQNDLDEGSVHETLAPYLRAWKRFCADHKFECETAETLGYSERWQFAGTFDVLGTWKQLRRRPRVLIDVKSGDPDPSHGPQTAAYVQIAQEIGLLAKNEMPQRAVVRLQPNGFYQVDPMLDPADWSTFIAALTCYKFKQRNGLLGW
jgi:hypothetical protein